MKISDITDVQRDNLITAIVDSIDSWDQKTLLQWAKDQMERNLEDCCNEVLLDSFEQTYLTSWICPFYDNEEVLPNENGLCSLCNLHRA